MLVTTALAPLPVAIGITLTPTLPLFHIPPVAALYKVVVPPAHTDVVPVMGITGFTVITLDTVQPVPNE